MWTASDATSCTVSGGWSGTQPVNGSQSVSPTTMTSYTLSCTGSGGGVNKMVTVSVTAPPTNQPPTVSAGSDQTVTLPAAATLNGAVDVIDLGILLSQWNRGGSGDLNADGRVDVIDLGILLSQWGRVGSADLNNDGIVDAIDLGISLSNWS